MELVNFEGKEIRTIEHESKTWYSVVDVVGAVSESSNSSGYWRTLKKRLKGEGSQVVTNCHKLKLEAADGKRYNTDCATRETILRLIQSIPSPNAEPFKMWLANTGEQNISEQENPQIMLDKIYSFFKRKGHDEEWIKNRLRGMQIRKELTDYWDENGVEGQDFARLTDTIAKGTFGLTTGDHKSMKSLTPKDKLRDNMSNLELIFTALGEEVTKQIAKAKNATGFGENHEAAKEGGNAAGDSRKRLEKKIGIKVITKDNKLDQGK